MKNDETYEQFGKLIKKQREYMSLTQEELAKKVSLSRASIANIESGRQKVLLHQLYVFAKYLNKKPSELLPTIEIFEQDHSSPKMKTKKDQEWVSAIMRKAEDD